METRTNYERDDAAMEIRALVDLVEANVAPNTETAAWATEIASLQSEAAEASAPNAAINEVIELSTALA
jgi:hypothetical protein